MLSIVPEPEPQDTPFNEPYTVTLQGGQRATIEFTPEESGTVFYLATCAISKETQTTYEIQQDQTPMYGPSYIPPTDIDDLVATWTPAKTFRTSLTVIISNTGTTERTYHIQPVGYEAPANRGDAGGA